MCSSSSPSTSRTECPALVAASVWFLSLRDHGRIERKARRLAMKIGQVCTRDAVSVSASAPLIEAAQLMCQNQVGAAVVVVAPGERPTVIGIITDRDIVRVQLERVADLSRVRVADVMTRDPLVLNEDES